MIGKLYNLMNGQELTMCDTLSGFLFKSDTINIVWIFSELHTISPIWVATRLN